MMSILGALGGLFSGGAGSSSTTEQNYESTTEGTSSINRTELPGKIRSALEKLFTKGQLRQNQKATQGSLGALLTQTMEGAKSPFDVRAFVDGTMAQATNIAENDLAANINMAESAVGSTQGNNSMAMLLANRLRNETASNLAGVRSAATAEGTKIAEEQATGSAERAIGLTAGMTQQLATFLGLLRGAQTKQKQKTTEHTVGSSTSSTSQPFNFMSGLGSALSSFKAPQV